MIWITSSKTIADIQHQRKNTINYSGCIVVYQFYRERAIETERERDGVQIQILLQICMVGKSYYNSIISLSRIFVISYISARNNDKKICTLFIDVMYHWSIFQYINIWGKCALKCRRKTLLSLFLRYLR